MTKKRQKKRGPVQRRLSCPAVLILKYNTSDEHIPFVTCFKFEYRILSREKNRLLCSVCIFLMNTRNKKRAK